jgi:hypothetical protein
MNCRGGAEVKRVDGASKRGRVRQLLKIRRHPLLSDEVSTVSPLDLVRLGALGAVLAGVAWTASGVVAAGIGTGRDLEILGFASLQEALYVVAITGTLGGIVGLHARQVSSYGRLGTTGFLAAFMGTAVLLMGIVSSFVVGSASTPAFLDTVLGLGLWGAVVGFVLLGAATLRLRALPWWCGALLIVSLPLAIASGDYGGGAVLGLLWLAVGYALLSQHDVSVLLRTRRK